MSVWGGGRVWPCFWWVVVEVPTLCWASYETLLVREEGEYFITARERWDFSDLTCMEMLHFFLTDS